MNQLAKQSEVIGSTPSCRHYETTLIIEKDLTYEEWENLFHQVKRWKGSLGWWLGDCLIYGESKFGEKFSQVLDAEDFDSETMRVCQWVCSRVPIIRRNPKVNFSIYKLIAKYDEKEQEKLIDKILAMQMTVRDVSRMLAVKKQKDKEAEKSVPVTAMGYLTDCSRKMQDVLLEKPIDEWDGKSLSLLQVTFESMVMEIRKSYNWQEL